MSCTRVLLEICSLPQITQMFLTRTGHHPCALDCTGKALAHALQLTHAGYYTFLTRYIAGGEQFESLAICRQLGTDCDHY